MVCRSERPREPTDSTFLRLSRLARWNIDRYEFSCLFRLLDRVELRDLVRVVHLQYSSQHHADSQR